MKKGFTLVELLAVIVILALVALITIPVILNVIEKSKQKTYQRSIDSYGGAVNKAIAEYILDHEKDTSKMLTYQDIQSYIKYEGNKVECTVNIYSDKTIYLENCKVNNEAVDYTYGVYQEGPKLASKIENYMGYYADVDGDGDVDGVIYADLAHSKSGEWYNKENNWNKANGQYSYTSQTNLKKYTVSENKYNDRFGEKEIIALKPDSTGNKRFYVMALENFTTDLIREGVYHWYIQASPQMDASDTSISFGTGYDNTGTIIDIWNEGENGKYNAAQNDKDIFKHIQGEYAKGWYIPSKGEWAAFADYLSSKQENLLTNDCPTESCDGNGNYDDIYGLSSIYWSSSQINTYDIGIITFYAGNIGEYNAGNSCYVRLGITF